MASDWTSVWLASIGVGEYAQSFVDNGYDDQSICKVIGDDDLNAIGVQNARHRQLILDAVKCLGDDTRQGAAAPVYFEIEPEEQEKRSPPPVYYELEPEPAPAPKKLSRMQLKVKIRNEMKIDDVVLIEEPYSNPVSRKHDYRRKRPSEARRLLAPVCVLKCSHVHPLCLAGRLRRRGASGSNRGLRAPVRCERRRRAIVRRSDASSVSPLLFFERRRRRRR